MKFEYAMTREIAKKLAESRCQSQMPKSMSTSFIEQRERERAML